MNFDEWREIYFAGPLMNEAMARAAWDAAIAAEREACFQIALTIGDSHAGCRHTDEVARRIRARSQQ